MLSTACPSTQHGYVLDMSLLLDLGTDGVGSPWEEAGKGIPMLCCTVVAIAVPVGQGRAGSGSQDTLSECAAVGRCRCFVLLFFPLCMAT